MGARKRGLCSGRLQPRVRGGDPEPGITGGCWHGTGRSYKPPPFGGAAPSLQQRLLCDG